MIKFYKELQFLKEVNLNDSTIYKQLAKYY